MRCLLQVAFLQAAIDAEHARTFAGLRIPWADEELPQDRQEQQAGASSPSSSAMVLEPAEHSSSAQQGPARAHLAVSGSMREADFSALGKAAPKAYVALSAAAEARDPVAWRAFRASGSRGHTRRRLLAAAGGCACSCTACPLWGGATERPFAPVLFLPCCCSYI